MCNSKGLEVKNNNVPSTNVTKTWGANDDITSNDIIIPKLMLTQPTSKLCIDGKATPGKFIDSLNTSIVLGGEGKNVELIVFGAFKTWVCCCNGTCPFPFPFPLGDIYPFPLWFA